eukprot:scaffold72451_cov54-Phaeocystis_antarctica.AAC.2
MAPAREVFVIRTLLVLAELRDSRHDAGEGHAKRGQHEGAHARGALLDVVTNNLKHRLRRHRDRPDGVAGERLVDDHAADAHHGSAAVVALGVQLELLARETGLVLVPHPREGNHVTGPAVRLLLENRVVEQGDNQHNLHPRKARERRPRGNGAARHVRELNVLGERKVSRPADARLGQEHVHARGHREAAVLDLHLLEAAVLLGVLRHQLKRVIHTKRLGGAHITGGDGGHRDAHRRPGQAGSRGLEAEG